MNTPEQIVSWVETHLDVELDPFQRSVLVLLFEHQTTNVVKPATCTVVSPFSGNSCVLPAEHRANHQVQDGRWFSDRDIAVRAEGRSRQP